MSKYVILAERYKMARRSSKTREEANEILEEMREMVDRGEVTKNEMIAAAYI